MCKNHPVARNKLSLGPPKVNKINLTLLDYKTYTTLDPIV